MKGRLEFKEYIDAKNVYFVKNKENETLGDIEYYKDWKCWVFQPAISMIFSADCMKEIIDYMKNLN